MLLSRTKVSCFGEMTSTEAAAASKLIATVPIQHRTLKRYGRIGLLNQSPPRVGVDSMDRGVIGVHVCLCAFHTIGLSPLQGGLCNRCVQGLCSRSTRSSPVGTLYPYSPYHERWNNRRQCHPPPRVHSSCPSPVRQTVTTGRQCKQEPSRKDDELASGSIVPPLPVSRECCPIQAGGSLPGNPYPVTP
jgi:hypothetical protein